MDRAEYSALLESYIDSDAETQGSIMEQLVGEYDRLSGEITSATANIPNGFESWSDAYNDLRNKYVKRFVNGDESKPHSQPSDNNSVPSYDEAAKAFAEQILGRKIGE